jgi:hypothetical protein
MLRALVSADVEIRDDHVFSPYPCERCGEQGRLTTVRVYGDPRPSTDGFEGPEEACGPCAPALIAEAVQDKADRGGPIVVEVAC